MRSLFFSFLLYTSTLYANSEESYITSAVLINAPILAVVPIINYVQLKMHKNLYFHGSNRLFYFIFTGGITALVTELHLIKSEKRLKQSCHNKPFKPRVIKSNFAYGIILENQLLNKMLLRSESDQSCVELLNEAIVYPISISGYLRLSIKLKEKYLNENIRHLDLRYSTEEYSWFETLCLIGEKEDPEKKVLSVFNRVVLMDVCTNLINYDKYLPLENISEYSQSIVTGKGVSSFLAIDLSSESENSSFLISCNLKGEYLEFYNSDKSSTESALQEYIVNSHLEEINSSPYENAFYILGLTLSSGIFSAIIAYFIDNLSFYFFVGSCGICFSNVQYPGSRACGYHWFCTACLGRARSEHSRACPLCGV